jgi:hypothetical protein
MTDRACGPSAGGETETPPPATPLDGRASDRRKKNPSPLHARGSLGPSRANDASPSRALLFLSLPSPAARVTAVRRKNTTPNRIRRHSGPFYTGESRGGVERRQLKLKGVEGGD